MKHSCMPPLQPSIEDAGSCEAFHLFLTTQRCCASAAPQEQGSKSRVRGVEAHKQNIMAAKAVAKTLRSSLGPKARQAVAFASARRAAWADALYQTQGMDKMLTSSDGEVTISASRRLRSFLRSLTAA